MAETVDGVLLYFPLGLYDFKCTPWTIISLLAGHSSPDLLNWETYSDTQPGREEPNFPVVRIEFRTTVHSNGSVSTSCVFVCLGGGLMYAHYRPTV